MSIFGMTRKEWFAFGIGSALNGALFGVLIHSLFYLLLNGFCLGLNLYFFNAEPGSDNGSDNQ